MAEQVAEVTEPETTDVPEQEPAEAPAPVEPDGDEEGTEATVEPEQAPEQEPVSEKEIEKRVKQLEREAEKHTATVTRILEEDALSLVVCEACEPSIPGFHWPADSYPEDDPRRPLYELLAGGTDAQMRHPQYLTTCGECNGFGWVLTGSREQANRQLLCPVCQGSGYRNARNAQASPANVQASTNGAEPVEPEEAKGEEKDMWGRPVGHPRFGTMPIYMTEEEKAQDRAEGFELG